MAKAAKQSSTSSKKSSQHDTGRHSEMPFGYGRLLDFVTFLLDTARDGAADPRLTPRERARMVIQRDLLAGAFVELDKILNHGQPASVQKYRSRLLYEALGSASVIVSYRAENPFQKRKERESVTRAADGTKKKSQQRQEVLAALTGPLLLKNMNTAQIVSRIEETYNKQLETLGQAVQKTDTIHRLVDNYRKNARSSG
jgi:hypothetical protein